MRFYITIPAHRTEDGRDVPTWFFVDGHSFSTEFPDARLFKTHRQAYRELNAVSQRLLAPVPNKVTAAAIASVVARLTIVSEEGEA